MGRDIERITKRDGRQVPFDRERIVRAVEKAQRAVGREDAALARKLADTVVRRLGETGSPAIPSVEGVQDLVEAALIEAGEAEVAKAYILYRHRRAAARQAREALGLVDDLKLTLNASKVLEERYLRKDASGALVEKPTEMFRRVAKAVAEVDLAYERESSATESEERFYRMMTSLEFLPNSPTLMNAGTDLGQLSACFVLPVEDSIEGIFDALKYMALIHQSGGGTGFSFSRLRPRDDRVRSTGGVASGPVSFMRIFDQATDVIKQGGRRRGANMAILHVTHPDIVEFIRSKAGTDALRNFNISVAVTDEFMAAVRAGGEYELKNPRSGEVVSRLKAAEVFDMIVTSAWECGDPGLIFIDEINRHNPTPAAGAIEATNPCGEQPLLPYEACNLGSINLQKVFADGDVDWGKLESLVTEAVHFLDNVIDASRFPLEHIERTTRANRKIGLGVMGFADLLITMGMSYDSEDALAMGERLMEFISEKADEASAELGSKRGSFPNFERSVFLERGFGAMRNATRTTIAPTGTIGIIAGASSGIEPHFALSYLRRISEGASLIEVNSQFRDAIRDVGLDEERITGIVARTGSARAIEEVPEGLRRLFVTAMDIAPEWHVRMQAAFQKHTDNAVSKTVNLPEDSTPQDVREIYLLAHSLRCKGITVYRYGSKGGQTLTFGGPQDVGADFCGKERECST